MKKDLSIIIVSFNTKNLLAKCLRSIKTKLSTEIIVIDNGSVDGSKEFLKKQKVKAIFNKNNLGFAKATNQGIKMAQGEYILLLNSDTVIKKGSLERLVEFAAKTPDAGVVGARLLSPDGSIQPSCYYFPSILNGIKGRFLKFAPNRRQAVDAVVGAVFLIPRKTIEKIGLFDERYFMYYEDLDYCRRVWRAGLKVYYLPAAEVIHYHGASGKNLEGKPKQWLIYSSKIYHGAIGHFLINLIIWLRQKWQRLKKYS